MKKLVLASAVALLPALATAGLTGTQVDVRYEFDNGSTVIHTFDGVMVGSGVEITCPGSAQLCQVLTSPTQTLDLQDSGIRYEYVGPGSSFDNIAVNRFYFAMQGNAPQIIDAHLQTNIAGLTETRFLISGDSVQIDMRGLPLTNQAYFQFDLQLAPVPEPASAALLLGGLALLLARRRR